MEAYNAGGRVNGLALCAGVGGLELGLTLALGANYRTVCYVEREAFCAATLVARMEDKALDKAPIWDDLKTFDGRAWRGVVDIVSAGFPCQPFSTASRGRKVATDLWGECARVISECSPRIVFLENVVGAREKMLSVREDLRGMGFCVLPLLYAEAAAVGAPFKGRRVFLLAAADCNDEPLVQVHDEASFQSCSRSGWWEERPEMDRVDDGAPHRMDYERALGNGVVPLVAAHAFQTLAGRLR